jgi:hypothetical protein
MMPKATITAILAGLVLVGCATAPTPLQRGIAYYQDGHYVFAADEFTTAIQESPRLAAAYVNRGATRVRLGRIDEAIADYNRAIALEPADPVVYFNRGNALVAAGEPGLAVDDFTRAVERSPGFARARFNRGSAYALAGQPEPAMKDWLRAIETEPDPWARASMRRIAGLDPGAPVAAEGTPTTVSTVAPPPPPGTAAAAVPLPPPATLAATPPASPAASPGSPESIGARGLALRALGRELDGDHEGALRDLRAALALERDPARRQSLESLLRRLEAPR